MKGIFKKNRKTVLLLAAAFLILGAMAALTILLWPWFQQLSTPQGQEKLQSFVSSLGFTGWLVMLGIQVLQIVVAIIPGEPVEIIMGALYGAWGGFFTCTLGIIIGSGVVFGLVRFLGTPLVESIFGKDKLKSYSFLQNSKRLDTITFILFFLPGTPKDILTYVAGLTAIRPTRFLLIACFARIPSVLSSTWAGSTLAQGQLLTSIIIFSIVGLVSLCGIYLHKKVMHRLNRNPSSPES